MKEDTYRTMAELDTAIRIDTPNGGYKLYGIADKKVKSEFVTTYLPFDNKKKTFSVQCSKDGENFVNIEPCAVVNGHKYYVGADCMNFPLTLSSCVMLAHLIAKSNAISINGNTDFKYWRIGIDWECVGFDTWFSGDIDGKGILNDNYTPNNNFIAHFEL